MRYCVRIAPRGSTSLHRHPLLVWAMLLLLAGAASAQDNLLPNPSFEQMAQETAIPDGWSPWAKPNWAVFTFAAARTGAACVAITDDDPEVSQGLRSPKAPVEPGAVYRGSAWVMIERVQAGSFAVYLEYWAGNTRIADKSVGIPQAADWEQLEVAYPAPAGATHATVLVYGSSATVGRAYFDDVSLTRESPPD